MCVQIHRLISYDLLYAFKKIILGFIWNLKKSLSIENPRFKSIFQWDFKEISEENFGLKSFLCENLLAILVYSLMLVKNYFYDSYQKRLLVVNKGFKLVFLCKFTRYSRMISHAILKILLRILKKSFSRKSVFKSFVVAKLLAILIFDAFFRISSGAGSS